MSDPATSEESEFERLNRRAMTAEDNRINKEVVNWLFFSPPDDPEKLKLFGKAAEVPGFFERAKTALR